MAPGAHPAKPTQEDWEAPAAGRAGPVPGERVSRVTMGLLPSAEGVKEVGGGGVEGEVGPDQLSTLTTASPVRA